MRLTVLDRALADDAGWPSVAAGLVADLGFTLVGGDRPGPRGSHLLVALRDRPTGRHFDPERLEYFASAGARARLEVLDRGRAGRGPACRPALWGPLLVVDRLAATNRFLTFGGELRAIRIDDGLTVLDLWSPGPIARWGGHSQGTDRIAGSIGSFFGRLMVPVDFLPGAERRLDLATATTLYAAFLLDEGRRMSTPARVDCGPEGEALATWLMAERARIGQPDTWRAGRELLADLGLASQQRSGSAPP